MHGEVVTCLCHIRSHDACKYYSNWSSIYAHSYEPDLVHHLVDSDEECYDDEEDSNGKASGW